MVSTLLASLALHLIRPNVAGFGLGALNDADEDDLDVYGGIDPNGSRRRLAFDAEDEDETITLGAKSTLPKQTSSRPVSRWDSP